MHGSSDHCSSNLRDERGLAASNERTAQLPTFNSTTTARYHDYGSPQTLTHDRPPACSLCCGSRGSRSTRSPHGRPFLPYRLLSTISAPRRPSSPPKQQLLVGQPLRLFATGLRRRQCGWLCGTERLRCFVRWPFLLVRLERLAHWLCFRGSCRER